MDNLPTSRDPTSHREHVFCNTGNIKIVVNFGMTLLGNLSCLLRHPVFEMSQSSLAGPRNLCNATNSSATEYAIEVERFRVRT